MTDKLIKLTQSSTNPETLVKIGLVDYGMLWLEVIIKNKKRKKKKCQISMRAG